VGRHYASVVFFSGLVALLAESVFAAEPAAKARKKVEPGFDTAALDKRIADAKHVFIGEGVRIYFVDRRYRETPYIRAAGDGAVKSAMVVVKVVKLLQPAGTEVPAQVLVPTETSRDVYREERSRYDQEVERLVGKQGIWLGEIVVRKDLGEDPVALLETGPAGAKRRPAARPLPMNRLKQVTAAIERLKGGAQAAALKAD
jgi:hypothetical protein